MKILYDHQTFTNQDYGGISRYFYELIKIGKTDHENDFELILKYSNNTFIKNRDICIHKNFFLNNKFKGKRRLQMLLNKYNSTQHLKNNKFDIFHPTYYDTYFLSKLKTKNFTVTFLDMIHEKFASQYPELGNDQKLFNQKKELIKVAPKVIAISESTKNDLIEIYGVDANKIDVIYLGNSFNAYSEAEAPIVSKPYVLFVGSRKGYKNFAFCLTSLRNLLIKNNISFICAGGEIFSKHEISFIDQLGLSNLVSQYSITDKTLANLYKHSIAFIFPSLYEGFGIPILEAFACNTPCLLSYGGSLPEVGDDAALYFDPQNADAIEQSLYKILNDKTLKNDLIQKGNQRLQKFSWKNTYDSTIKFYKSLL